MKEFSSKRIAVKVDVYTLESTVRKRVKVDVPQDQKIYCLQARPCIFQPGHLTGWSREGVKGELSRSGTIGAVTDPVVSL